jgi:Tol biopolymer transport system component
MSISPTEATSASDSGRVLFTTLGEVGSIGSVRPDGSGLRILATNASTPVWSPDRRRIVFIRRVRIGEDFRGDPVYRADLHTMNADGSNQRLLTRAGVNPTWAPNSKTIAFVRGNFRLWSIKLDGSDERRVLDLEIEDPTWSPTGEWIAFSRAESKVEVWLVHPDGSGLRPLTKDAVEGTSPAWAPDGRSVTFHGWFGDEWLYKVDVASERAQRVSVCNGGNEWSPNGQWITCEVGFLEKNNGLWLVRPNGRNKTRLALRVDSVEWSPTGARIAFVRNARFYVMRSDGTKVRQVTRGSAPRAGAIDW